MKKPFSKAQTQNTNSLLPNWNTTKKNPSKQRDQSPTKVLPWGAPKELSSPPKERKSYQFITKESFLK